MQGNNVLGSALLFQCEPCADGAYSLGFGSSNGTAGVSKGIVCYGCSSGGECVHGGTVASAGHWGAADQATGVVQYIACPVGCVRVIKATGCVGC